MREAIGAVLPLAVGVAPSPFPIIAVILMLVGRRAEREGPELHRRLGLAVVDIVLLGIARPAKANPRSVSAGTSCRIRRCPGRSPPRWRTE